jgi:hypothetical protein
MDIYRNLRETRYGQRLTPRIPPRRSVSTPCPPPHRNPHLTAEHLASTHCSGYLCRVQGTLAVFDRARSLIDSIVLVSALGTLLKHVYCGSPPLLTKLRTRRPHKLQGSARRSWRSRNQASNPPDLSSKGRTPHLEDSIAVRAVFACLSSHASSWCGMCSRLRVYMGYS